MTTHSELWTAFHEAGHLAACILTSTPWSRATVTPADPDLDGGVWFTTDDEVTRALIAWAGPWAEAWWCDYNVPSLIESPHCDVDRPLFEPIVTTDPSLTRDWHALLIEQWPLVERIAVTLHVHGTITPADDLVSQSFAYQYLHADRRVPVVSVLDQPEGGGSFNSLAVVPAALRSDAAGDTSMAPAASTDPGGTAARVHPERCVMCSGGLARSSVIRGWCISCAADLRREADDFRTMRAEHDARWRELDAALAIEPMSVAIEQRWNQDDS